MSKKQASKTERKSVRVLHFADAHIDMVNFGRHDLESGLPIRVVDFLRALDQIVETAISEKVDLVIFAGDAYRNQRPHPKFQREWQKRMMRLSAENIPTVLLVGNHDTSPSAQGAHALQEFKTLKIPHIHVADVPELISAETLGCAAQVISIPWISRSRLVALAGEDKGDGEIWEQLEEVVEQVINNQIAAANPDLPLILTAHASVQGAKYGSERQVMLGKDLVLGGGIVSNPKFDYVALGHIHQHQDVSGGGQPPVVYSGSIERIDFGEIKETKGFVLAEVSKGQTEWEFVPLQTRKFKNTAITLTNADSFMQTIMDNLPPQADIVDAICRLQLTYEREHEPLLDEAEIGRYYADALSLQIAKNRSAETRSRLGETQDVEQLTPSELLSTYWDTISVGAEEAGELQKLAKEIFKEMVY